MKGLLFIKCLICILLLSGTTLFAQKKDIDSLNSLLASAPENKKAELYAKLSFSYKRNNTEKRLEYINKAIELADKYNDTISKALALYSLSHYYFNKQMFLKADSIGKINLQLSLKTLDSLTISNSYYFYGDYYFWQADYNNACIYYKKALDFSPSHLIKRRYEVMHMYAMSLNNISNYAEAMKYLLKIINYYETKVHDINKLAHLYNLLAFLFEEMEDYETSKKYYNKSLHLFDSISDFTKTEIFKGIGLICKKTQKLDSAIIYLKKAAIFAEKSKHQIIIADVNTELGDLYIEMNKPDSAFLLYKKVIKIANEQGDNWALVYGNMGLAKVYNKKQNYGKALFYLYKVKPIAQQINANELLIDYYKVLANTLALNGNFKDAYYYMKLYNKVNNSYYKEKSAKELAILKVRYETEKKEQENKRLQMENKFKEQNLKNQRYINIAIVILLILTILFAVIIFIGKKKIQQANELLKEKNTEIINQNEEITLKSEEISKAYTKLKELNEYKQGLSDMIIHDLKNPLNVILNMAENDIVKEAANKMFRLISDILDVSKLEETKLILNKQNVSLNEIVNHALQTTKFSANISGIEIINNISDNLYVYVDKDITVRILINLISNAIKFSPNESKIILDAKKTENNKVLVSITDFGAGIPEEEIDHIFDKFIQFKAVNSKTFRSTGLGLTFCKLAVEAQGGKIKVESSVNTGSVFSFTLTKGENNT